LSKKSVVHSIRCEQKVKTTVWSMATTTKLVNNIFENDIICLLDDKFLLANLLNIIKIITRYIATF